MYIDGAPVRFDGLGLGSIGLGSVSVARAALTTGPPDLGLTDWHDGVIEYTTAEYNGTWMIFEDTQKSHVSTTYHGRVFDRYAGEIVDTVTGSETPSTEWPNPVVTERTWAERLSSYTGSAPWPVPLMTDATWAKVAQSTIAVILPTMSLSRRIASTP